MKFFEMFKNKTAVRYFIFGIFVFAATIVFSYIDSANDVKVTIGDSEVTIHSDYNSMSISYKDIQSIELVPIPEAGTVVSGKDNMTLRYGTWINDYWGEHFICADLDCTNCIAVKVDDGRVLVFSSKNNDTTQQIYETLLEKIGQ